MVSTSNIAAQPPSSLTTRRRVEAPLPRSAIILPPPAAIAPRDALAGKSSLSSRCPCSEMVGNLSSIKQPVDSKDGKEVTSSHPWHVTEVPNVPAYFPIERTHAILADVSPSVIADRVATCLRERCIAAIYSDKKAMCLAETGDCTKFYIRLFQSDNCGAVLVEVQRRCGSCVCFHEAARAVLQAAKGVPPEVSKARPSLSESFLAKAREFECTCKLEKNRDSNDKEQNAIGALEIADCLLHKDRLDANMLGMESLRFLTDPLSSGTETATIVAKAIFCRESNGLAIRDALTSLIHFWNLNKDFDVEGCDLENRINGIMHNHALAVLANSVELMVNKGEIKACAIPTELLGDELLSTLATELSNSKTKPDNAYEAARCINGLMAASADFKSRVKGQGVLSLVKGLVSSGVCNHVLLERELDKTLRSFTTCI